MSVSYRDLPADVGDRQPHLPARRRRSRCASSTRTRPRSKRRRVRRRRCARRKASTIPTVRSTSARSPSAISSILAFGLDQGVDYVAISFVALGRGRQARQGVHRRARQDDPGHREDRKARSARRSRQHHRGRRRHHGGARRSRHRDSDRSACRSCRSRSSASAIARANRSITATQMLESMICVVAADPRRSHRRRQRHLGRHRCRDALGRNRDAACTRPKPYARWPKSHAKSKPNIRTPHCATAASTARSSRSRPRSPKLQRAPAPNSNIPFIVTGTTTGNTAHHIAAFRPQARIVALTPDPQVARRLALSVGNRIAADRSIRLVRRADLHDRTRNGRARLSEQGRSHCLHDRHPGRRRRHQRSKDPSDRVSQPA